MTKGRPPAALRPDQRTHLATLLNDLATQLAATDAQRALETLATVAQDCWSSQTGGTPSGPGNGSPTERAALGMQPASVRAAVALELLQQLTSKTTIVLNALDEVRPDRPRWSCPAGHALTHNGARCRECANLPRCQNPQHHDEHGNPAKIMPPDRPRTRHTIIGELALCKNCWRHAKDHDGRLWGDPIRLNPTVDV